MTPHLIPSLLYNLFVRSQGLQNRKVIGPLWKRAYDSARHVFQGPVSTRIHDRKVLVNFGYTYPIFARRYPGFNQPLVELVHQAYVIAGRKAVTIVDVGAAVGDTVFLLERNCQGMVTKYICVDGYAEFFDYLRENLGGREDVALVYALLSATSGSERALIKTPSGTASAQGDALAPSTTLDRVVESLGFPKVDVLKVDADGFDGRILLGAHELLGRDMPAVIFEWHPGLCVQTGNSGLEHFQALNRRGYRTFIWFTKFGVFSHFSAAFDQKAIQLLSEICLRGRHSYDWHYDIVALHEKTALSPLDIAELRYAKRRESRW